MQKKRKIKIVSLYQKLFQKSILSSLQNSLQSSLKNSLQKTLYKVLLITNLLAITGTLESCQLFQRIQTKPSSSEATGPAPSRSNDFNQPPSTGAISPPGKVKQAAIPRIGIILSAGGAKTYAHIGFLQELNKHKIPIHSIVGIEFSAPMAALYARKEIANEVEWQMLKIKNQDLSSTGLLSTNKKSADLSILNDFFKLAFGGLKNEELKLPFACPAYNLSKETHYMMNKGSVINLLELCMAYPPVFRPYRKNVSGIREIKAAADYLIGTGANFVVFVNALETASSGGIVNTTLAQGDDSLNLLWSEVRAHYAKPPSNIDMTINIGTPEFGLLDFNKHRDIMLKGAKESEKQIDRLAQKLGI